MFLLNVSCSHLTVGFSTIFCKPPLCSSLTNTTAEIHCEVSGTPPPSTKIEHWIKINKNELPSPADSNRFSIVGAESSMPVITISPLDCDGDNYSISFENMLEYHNLTIGTLHVLLEYLVNYVHLVFILNNV